MRDFRNELLREIELNLPEEWKAEVIATVTMALEHYEVTERCTEVALVCENESILKMYASCLLLDGKSKKTINAYIRQMKRFGSFLNKDLREASTFDVRNYMAQEKVRGVSNRTMENTRSYISAFYDWLFREGHIEKNPCLPIKPVKYSSEKEDPFTAVELDTLRTACKNQRERAIVEFLLSTGVRASEFADIEMRDIDFDKMTVRIRHGKGDKERYVYFDELTKTHLIKYLMEKNIETGVVFRSNRGVNYTVSGLEKLLVTLGKRSGVENVHPHRFRRTLATNLARRGMNVQEVQSILGHSCISTTMIYVSLTEEQVQTSYKNYVA